MQLSIVIPAYREAEALTLLLPRLHEEVRRLTAEYEILIVDTPEPMDETAQVCAAHAVTHLPRRGGTTYGDAIRTGFSAARGEYLLVMDADGSHNPAQIRLLWERRSDHDLVIGSRYVAGGQTQNPAILIFMSWVVNVAYRVVFGLRIQDVSNSFRLYRTALVQPIPLVCNSFDLVEEVLIKLQQRVGPGRITEVPITFEKRKRGESKRKLVQFAFSYVATIIRLRRVTRSSTARSRTARAD